MKFCEAMDKLKSGSKVTREPWREGIYFKIVETDVKSFQPKLEPYSYNEDIMISDGWLITGSTEEYKFCDIIPFLQKGSQAKLKSWNEMFIYFDRDEKILVLNSMEMFPFIPYFEAFTATDWIEII